ncbi:DNA cytosine methyltransferase [Arthrobacter liuii]|uniref:DNA (cytosine-5-)-methyltransferase n=1 Tax=Arthrobacter liuii TaxID=1476996 RepID=A0ABQ2AR50_9MICC|nr:DNA cytosine methyltransferase [Arthrobacter liuii]GGH93904.1 DNA methylase [Arthrobacter liuii]
MNQSRAHIKALDLFAGTGWGVACQRLGIKESGVEIMPEAVATRAANGMETIYHDVWDGITLTAEQHLDQYGPYGLLIASPPCQTFSLAGKGAGRAALNEVLEAIDLHAYKDADALRAFGEKHDPRTALVLTPLAYIWRDRPRLVAMEQVPTVLPVWEACAEVMREWGYEVKTEILNAEQYGVPQTRKRAILVARRGGSVHLPTPTHSRYYSRTPEKLDPGVKKWVSMAEALGWGDADRTICHGVQKHSARRPMTEPAATIAFGHDSASVGFASANVGDHLGLRAAKRDGGFVPVTVEQAAVLQSYPGMLRSNYGTGGDASNRGERSADQPAPTLTSKADRNKWDGERNMTTDEAAALQSYPATVVRTSMGKPKEDDRNGSHELDPFNRPAHTLTSKSDQWLIKCADTARKIALDEAGTLQTYERPFVWCGTKTKQFLQIGNAVPPLLAEHILAALIGIPTTQEKK